jgi:thiamine pyrophosphate-dependent acetolactate synthase large subunit-like protein
VEPDATYVQVDAAASRVGWHVPAEIPIVGDPKLVLGQLAERAAALGIDGAGAERRVARRDRADARPVRARAPRAGRRGARRRPDPSGARHRDLLETMDRDARSSSTASRSPAGCRSGSPRFAGQIVDAARSPVGHGIGMGIGVQLARPGSRSSS